MKNKFSIRGLVLSQLMIFSFVLLSLATIVQVAQAGGYGPHPDLRISVTASPEPVYAGAELIYTIDIANYGPVPATRVTVTDTLPWAVSYVRSEPVSCTPLGSSRTDGTYTCSIGSIDASGGPSDHYRLTIVVRASEVMTPLDIFNIASVDSVEHDLPEFSHDNITPSVRSRINPSPNLSVSKIGPSVTLAGVDFAYTITVSNSGFGRASGVRVTDRLPPGVRYIRSYKSDGTECSHAYSDAERAWTVTCDIGTLGPGASAIVTIWVRPMTAGTINNDASVINTSPEPDIDTSNNTSNIVTTTVNPAANLVIVKVSGPAYVGVALTYWPTLVNGGPSEATHVTVTDTLPAGVEYVPPDARSEPRTDSRCSSLPDSMRRVTCTIGTMAVPSLVRFPIVVRPTAVGEITNVASVRADQADPDMMNNTATLRTTVNPAADLVLTKTADQTRVRYGTNLTYTITVRNQGPSTASNVVVTEPMPAAGRSAGTVFVSATPSQGNCPTTPARGDTTGTIICNLGDLAGGASATVTVVVTPFYTMPTPAPFGFVPPDTVVENTASVHADTFDPNSANNTATVRVTATAGTTIPFTPPSPMPGPRPIPAPL